MSAVQKRLRIFVFDMADVSDYPLYSELLELIRNHISDNKETQKSFGERVELDRQYVQQVHAGIMMPGLDKADMLARSAGKKFILVDVGFDESSIKTININP